MKAKRIKVIQCKRKESIMPTTERRKQIEETVNGIISEYGLSKPGFNLIGFLSTQQGFKVGIQDLDDDTTGMLLVNEKQSITDTNCNRLIVINSSLEQDPEYLQKRRFITAHEYGHYVLHKKSNEIYAHRDTTSRNAPLEKEADYFARCLLMPEKLVKEIYSIWDLGNASEDERIAIIAQVFKVSQKKAKLRLSEVSV